EGAAAGVAGGASFFSPPPSGAGAASPAFFGAPPQPPPRRRDAATTHEIAVVMMRRIMRTPPQAPGAAVLPRTLGGVYTSHLSHAGEPKAGLRGGAACGFLVCRHRPSSVGRLLMRAAGSVGAVIFIMLAGAPSIAHAQPKPPDNTKPVRYIP